jgi:hypothetical protein
MTKSSSTAEVDCKKGVLAELVPDKVVCQFRRTRLTASTVIPGKMALRSVVGGWRGCSKQNMGLAPGLADGVNHTSHREDTDVGVGASGRGPHQPTTELMAKTGRCQAQGRV